MAACRVISIFSPKGGVGKTVLASNIAIALAQEHQKVLLLDFDLSGPLELAKSLNISPKSSLYDFSATSDDDLTRQLPDRLVKYSENLDYFPAIFKINQLGHISGELSRKLIDTLKEKYNYVIIDAGSQFNEVLIKVLDSSHLILMIANPDVLSVYKTEWAMDILQSLHFPLNMIRVILNRAESKGSVSWQEMKVVLPVEIIAMIPSDGKAVTLALNRQIPVVVGDPQSKFSVSVKKLAKDLMERQFYVEHHTAADYGANALGKTDFWQKSDLASGAPRKNTESEDEIIKLKQKIHHRLIEELHVDHLGNVGDSGSERYQSMRQKVEQTITNILSSETGKFISSTEVRKTLIGEIVDEVLGLGPLEDLIKDETITEIMVNNKDNVYIEKDGKIELTNRRFVTNEQIRSTIERIIAPLGRRIDESNPMVDARLTDGSRVNAIIPPLALTGPTLTIRKFSKHRLTVEDLVDRYDSLSADMARFLEACVKTRRNILVSGGTDSGKTTFLNILSEFIPNGERVITIEDAAELKLHHRHWIRLESRPPNIEGKGEVTMRELFRNTLRMRPDRIVVGEVRGKEVLDMLQAMNTGHDGSMSTVHANSTQDVLIRLDSMILMSGVELPLRAIREMISSAIEMVVHTARLPDGSRKIIQITEVTGMLDDTRVELKDIFLFKQSGLGENNKVMGKFQATGYVPSFFDKIKVSGFDLSENVFNPDNK